MNKTLVTLAAVLAPLVAMSAPAAAESYDATQPPPPKGTYVMAGASLGGSRDLKAGVHVEAGKAAAANPRLFYRGQIESGMSGNAGGDYEQLRVGVEGRTCAVREFFCTFAGLDVGYQHDHVHSTPWLVFPDGGNEPQTTDINAHDAIAVPRAGLEMGYHVKAHVTAELPFYRRVDSHMDSDKDAGGVGFMLSAGVGYAF